MDKITALTSYQPESVMLGARLFNQRCNPCCLYKRSGHISTSFGWSV